jgi:Arc/MetJ family transcription regulator
MRLDIDEQLLREAMELGHHDTRSAAVNEALAEYVQLRKRSLSATGSPFWSDWDNPQDAEYDNYKGRSR